MALFVEQRSMNELDTCPVSCSPMIITIGRTSITKFDSFTEANGTMGIARFNFKER